MKHRLTWAGLVVLATTLISGCAGGWRHGTPPGAEESGTPAATPTTSTAAAPSAAAGDGTTFTYRGEGNTVALAGDFNNWSTSADMMKKLADGSWTITKKLEPGKHQYKFVIDGGTWKEDPNAKESEDDGYGGKNSVVVVPAGATTAAPAPATQASSPAASGASAPVAGGTTFTYRGAANGVALAGDFNNWSTSADPMTKGADGSWTITKKLEPGKHQYKFVIDGGTWKEDPNAKESEDDGYGGKNSVVVVPAGATTATASAEGGVTAAAPPAAGQGRAPVQTADGVTFTYPGPARSVNLAGDFNGWSTTADPMTRQADGSWTITKKLAAGSHEYKFVVDGSTWKQDEANPKSNADPYGGMNSVVVVK